MQKEVRFAVYSRVYVEITNICNMHCSFCHGHSRLTKRMERDEFACILEQLKGQTQYIYYHLMGEPLTHPDLPLFLQMAAEQGYRSVITTNGTLLDKSGTALIAGKPHKVNISLHSFETGDDQAHERYLQKVTEFADKATKAGILVSLRLWNEGCDGGRNAATEGFLRQHLPGQWVRNTRGYRIREKLYLEWDGRFSWPDKDGAEQGEQVFCYGLRDHFGILCDGTVVPCCLDSDGMINLGNIFREEITEILASDRAKAMAQGFSCRKATEDLCRRCGYAQRFSK